MKRVLFLIAALGLIAALVLPSMAVAQLPDPATCATRNMGPAAGTTQTGCDQYHSSMPGQIMHLESTCFSQAPWVYFDTVYEIETVIQACDERKIPGPLYAETLIDGEEYLVMTQRSTSYDKSGKWTDGNGLGYYRMMDVQDFWTVAGGMPANPELWRIVELSGTIYDTDSMSYVYFPEGNADCYADTSPYVPGTQSVMGIYKDDCAYSTTCAPTTALPDLIRVEIHQVATIDQVKVFPGDGDMNYPGGTPYVDNSFAADKNVKFMYELIPGQIDETDCPDHADMTMACEQMNYEVFTVKEGDEDRNGAVDYVDLGHVLGSYDEVAGCWCPGGLWWPGNLYF